MLISDIPSTVSYVYTGVDTFPVPFSFYGLTTVKVGYRADSDPTSASPYVPLVYETDYTVTGVKGSENDGDQAFKSGSVTLTNIGAAKIPSSGIVVVMRETPLEQQFAYNELDNFPAKSHENGLGRQAIISQEITAKLSRALMVQPGTETNGQDLLQATLSTMFAARDAAEVSAENSNTSAEASASSAAAASNQASAAAVSAAAAAQSALDAAAAVPENLVQRVGTVEAKTGPATTTSRGIARVAALADMEPDAVVENGPAVIDVKGGVITTTPTAYAVPQADASGKIPVGFIPGTFVGDIRLLPFRAADLATHCPGWLFCNGDRFANGTVTAEKLNALPQNLKTDFGIMNDGTNTTAPNLFYTDGRGVFLRAVDGTTRQVGNKQSDTIRNLTGVLSWHLGGWRPGSASGVFQQGAYTNQYGAHYQTGPEAYNVNFDASAQVPTGSENKPLDMGMTPAIFIGS